jgi:hypothetical protein
MSTSVRVPNIIRNVFRELLRESGILSDIDDQALDNGIVSFIKSSRCSSAAPSMERLQLHGVNQSNGPLEQNRQSAKRSLPSPPCSNGRASKRSRSSAATPSVGDRSEPITTNKQADDNTEKLMTQSSPLGIDHRGSEPFRTHQSGANLAISNSQDVEELLGYHFSEPNLLKEALMAAGAPASDKHISNEKQDNRRLALVGDAVLRLVLLDNWYKSGANIGTHINLTASVN